MTRTTIAAAVIALSAATALAGDREFACEDGTALTYDHSSRAMFITGVIEGFKLAIPPRSGGQGYELFTASKAASDGCDYHVAPCVEESAADGLDVVFYVVSATGPVVNCSEIEIDAVSAN